MMLKSIKASEETLDIINLERKRFPKADKPLYGSVATRVAIFPLYEQHEYEDASEGIRIDQNASEHIITHQEEIYKA